MSSYPTLFGCPSGAAGAVVVLGLSSDAGTTAMPGAAQGPEVLRQLSAGEAIGQGPLWDLATGKPYFRGKRLSDLGNVRFRTSQRAEDYLALVQTSVSTLLGARKKTLCLGGDHLVTLPILRAYAAHFGPLQVVQIDAHHDYREVGAEELPTHSTFMRYAMSERLVNKVVQVGVRGLSGAVPAKLAAITQCRVEGVRRALTPRMPVYLTVDTDGIDPALAPGVGYPVPGGLPWSAIDATLRAIEGSGARLVGADWTEYNPRFDTPHHLTGLGVLYGVAKILRQLLSKGSA